MKVFTDLKQALKNSNVKALHLVGPEFSELPAGIEKLIQLEELVLQNNGLKSIPKRLLRLKKLKRLNLMMNNLESLPENIHRLENLEELNLFYNKLRSLPENIVHLGKLKVLQLSQNDLINLPYHLGRLRNLEVLSVSSNIGFQNLPFSVYDLPRLKELDLSRTAVPLYKSIGHLRSLEILRIDHNKLTHLNPSIWSLPNLRVLSAKGNHFTSYTLKFQKSPVQILDLAECSLLKSLPSSLSKLSHLRHLNLSGCHRLRNLKPISQLNMVENLDLTSCQLRSFPPEICKLPLKVLRLGHNQLTNLPRRFAKLKNLEYLQLSDNRFTTFPIEVCSCTSLKTLKLGSGYQWRPNEPMWVGPQKTFRISALPKELGKLVNIKELSLSKHKIRALPNTIGKLRKLEKLDITGNSITQLPQSFTKLENLRELEILGNGLCALPKDIHRLKNLSSLDADYNKIETVPAGIGKCTQLVRLRLMINPIKKLPESIGNLKKLDLFFINDCNLTELPKNISKLSKLRVFGFQHNPLKSLPTEFGKLKINHLGLGKDQVKLIPDSWKKMPVQILSVYDHPLTGKEKARLKKLFPNA